MSLTASSPRTIALLALALLAAFGAALAVGSATKGSSGGGDEGVKVVHSQPAAPKVSALAAPAALPAVAKAPAKKKAATSSASTSAPAATTPAPAASTPAPAPSTPKSSGGGGGGSGGSVIEG